MEQEPTQRQCSLPRAVPMRDRRVRLLKTKTEAFPRTKRWLQPLKNRDLRTLRSVTFRLTKLVKIYWSLRTLPQLLLISTRPRCHSLRHSSLEVSSKQSPTPALSAIWARTLSTPLQPLSPQIQTLQRPSRVILCWSQTRRRESDAANTSASTLLRCLIPRTISLTSHQLLFPKVRPSASFPTSKTWSVSSPQAEIWTNPPLYRLLAHP